LRPTFAELARNKQTTGLGHVTVADLKRLRVVCPDEAVLRQFDETVRPVHEKVFENNRTIANLEELRDTLLPRLTSGQLRLPEAEALVA
jgi:type I restriction enzyme S subunit